MASASFPLAATSPAHPTTQETRDAPLLQPTGETSADANIDPALRDHRHTAFVQPIKDGILVPEHVFQTYLHTIKRRGPLQDACNQLGITHAKRATIEKLRDVLTRHWYRQGDAPSLSGAVPATQPTRSMTIPSTANNPPAASAPPHALSSPPIATPSATRSSTSSTVMRVTIVDDADLDMDDNALMREYDVEGGAAEEALGSFDSGGLEDDGQDDDEEDEDIDLEDDGEPAFIDVYNKFRRDTRVSAAERTEQNRRAGGKKTQKCMVKSWNIFQQQAVAKGEIRDGIVDEHALLLYLNFSAARCRRNRRGEDIPNTRIGASQIKKEFFGALRVRKVQDARDPTLIKRRPATTVYVYDLVKTRMNEALKNSHEGLAGEDAPDIVANTFLAQLSDATLTKIGHGFLDHRELKATINGHLSWTMMNASGNRGDDIRALRLCEMQPYVFLHPNGETPVPSVLGLQSEQKATRRGMKTTINPTYTCFIAHRDPTMCPLGAFALYLHFIHDYAKIDEKYKLDYSSNTSWRPVRLLHGSSAVVPYNETALQNLFCMSYKAAGVESRLKAHLARHMLGYHQEKMGVDANDTSKLGWSRDTYMNTYAPALPKPAILGAHGYKVHEEYKPLWRHVSVPEAFISRVGPMAEANVELIEGKQNLVGATNYWEMVISLRPYLFQCAAAIYQVRPNSSIFRLPALAHDDVKLWMSTEFPAQLAVLTGAAGDPVDLARIENSILREALEELRTHSSRQVRQLEEQAKQLALLNDKFDRRTAQWTPLKAPTYGMLSSHPQTTLTSVQRQLMFGEISPPRLTSSTLLPSMLPSPLAIDPQTRASEDTGVYNAHDQTLRGFIAPSPRADHLPRPRTEVDLVLPPLLAFYTPGEAVLPLPPILGQGSAQWTNIFAKIRQCGPLWDAWKPSTTLDQMSLQQVWACYNTGEAVVNADGIPSGMKPPLRLVEQYFKADWRKGSAPRKFWQRFREIPEWIETSIKVRGITAPAALLELEGMRTVSDRIGLLGTSAVSTLLADQRKAAAKMPQLSSPPSESSTELPSPLSESSILPPDNSPPTLSAPSGSSSPPRKRRAPTVGGRGKQKKFKS